MSKYHGAILFVSGEKNYIMQTDVKTSIDDAVRCACESFSVLALMKVQNFAVVCHENDVPMCSFLFHDDNGEYAIYAHCDLTKSA